MLRPERVRIGDGERRDGHNVLDARVTDVIYQGDTFLVQAVLADGSRISARGIASAGALGARARGRRRTRRSASRAQDAVLIPHDAAMSMAALADAPDRRRVRRPTRAACAATSCVERLSLLGLARARRSCWSLVTMVLPVAWLFGLSLPRRRRQPLARCTTGG